MTTTNKETTLKLCFCLSMPKLERHEYSGDIRIKCDLCGIRTGWTPHPDYIIRDWNNRPEEDRLNAMIEGEQKISLYRLNLIRDKDAEIERLKAENQRLQAKIMIFKGAFEMPHPTCKTCKNKWTCEYKKTSEKIDEKPINYCSAHTALKEGDS